MTDVTPEFRARVADAIERNSEVLRLLEPNDKPKRFWIWAVCWQDYSEPWGWDPQSFHAREGEALWELARVREAGDPYDRYSVQRYEIPEPKVEVE